MAADGAAVDGMPPSAATTRRASASAGLADKAIEVLLLAGKEDDELCGVLRSRGIATVRDLVYLPAWELRDWLLVPEDAAEAILQRAWAACAAPAATAWDLASQRPAAAAAAAPAPLAVLGAALGGGLAGALVEVAGPPGHGKTQFCLHAAALAAARGGEVFWIDTERTFSPQRLLELLLAAHGGEESLAMDALGRVRCRSCASLLDLSRIVEELASCASRGEPLPALLVIDSVASVARSEGGGDGGAASRRDYIPKRQAMLNSLASLLKMLASTAVVVGSLQRMAVLVTNQVHGDPSRGGCKVTLGNVWHHAVNHRVVISRSGHGRLSFQPLPAVGAEDVRYLRLEKSACAAPFTICFVIGPAGLQEVGTRRG